MEDTTKSEQEWLDVLSEEEYEVLREGKTEPRFSGEHIGEKKEGKYECAGCGATLFQSDTKFDSGTGWPSFYDVADSNNVKTQKDTSHGMNRIEVKCSECDGHLGHVFEDGPEPTGKRYCINSLALDFENE